MPRRLQASTRTARNRVAIQVGRNVRAAASTMPCAHPSSPRSNANCSTAPASAPRPKRARPFFSSSKDDGTIGIVVTLVSTLSHPTGTKLRMLVPHDSRVATCPRKRGNFRCGRYCLSRNCLPKQPRHKSGNILSIAPVQPPAACLSGIQPKFSPDLTLSNIGAFPWILRSV